MIIRLEIKRDDLWEMKEVKEIIKKVREEIKKIDLWRKLNRDNRRDITWLILVIETFAFCKLLLSL